MAKKFTELHNVGSVFYARVSPQRAKLITELQAAESAKEAKSKGSKEQLKASKKQAIIDDMASLEWLKHPVKAGDTVQLESGEIVGTVKQIQHGVGQSLLIVDEHLIPLVEDFVVSQSEGILTMKLPDGLLDL